MQFHTKEYTMYSILALQRYRRETYSLHIYIGCGIDILYIWWYKIHTHKYYINIFAL